MRAIITVQNRRDGFRDDAVDADFRRNLPRDRDLRSLASQQGRFRRGGENAVAGGMKIMTDHSDFDSVTGKTTTVMSGTASRS